MSQLDTGGARTAYVRKPKKPKPLVVRATPDQADRQRSPAQKARDQRAVNRNIAHAQARARVTPDQADRQRSPVQKAQDRQAVAQVVAESRQKFLGKQGRGGGVRAVKRELEGRGVAAGAANWVAERGAKQGLHPLTGNALTAGLGIKDSTVAREAGRTFKDLINAPAQLVPSVYIPVAAGVEALRGHPQRLKDLGHQISTTDPVFNLQAAQIDYLIGHRKAGAKRLEQAKKAVAEHPGFAALEVFGAKGVLGRGAGAAVRTGARVTKSETLRKIGTTERTPKTLPRTNIAEHRRYSKDLTTKAIQVLRENQKSRRANDLREEAKHHPNPEERKALKAQARKVDPERIRDRDIQKAVDHHVAVVDDVRRINQAKTLKEENKTYKETKKTGPLASLVTQRIIRPTLKSMERYKEDLIKVGENLKGAKLDANQQLVHDLDQAIEKVKSGKLSTEQLKAIANHYGKISVESQAGLTSRGIYSQEQSDRRAVLPFAIKEMGAHRDPEYLTGKETAARKVATKASKGAARARGKTLQARRAHTTASEAAQATLKRHEELPTPPWALKVLQGKAAAESAAREKLVAKSTKRSAKATTASREAAGVLDAAKKLRQADPMLIEHQVTREVPVSTKRPTRVVVSETNRAQHTPTIAALTHHLPEIGKPGVHREGAIDRATFEATGDKLPRSDIALYTMRDKDGRIIGALESHAPYPRLDAEGNPIKRNGKTVWAVNENSIVVDPKFRRQGIASKLYAAADRDGIDVHNPSAVHNSFTDEGASLVNAMRKAAASKTKRVTTTEKRKLETSEALAAMRKLHGEDAIPGVVSQTPAFESGGGDYLQIPDKPKAGEKRRLGGHATLEGTLDASPERMLRQHVRARALSDAHDAWTHFIDQFAYRKKGENAKVKTYKDKATVTQAVNDLNAEGDVKWRVVRLSPFKDGDPQLQKVLEGANDIDPAEFEANAFTDALGGADREAPTIPQDGPWAIIPDAAAKQMLHHNSLMNPVAGARALRSVSSGFRRTVLGTSLPWMVGNISEAGLRSAINRVGPGSVVRGYRISHAIDRLAKTPEDAQYAKARLLGGGHYAFADRRIHANLDAYTDGFVKDVTSNWRKVWNESPAKVAPWLWDRWTHFAFNTVNKNIENFFQTGMLGRAAKDQLMPDSLRAASQAAIDEMAKGVIKPNTARSLKLEIDRMYGKYSGFSPSEKFFIANYTPFGAWLRNAGDLLLRMPERHPLTTLAGTEAVNATEPERQAQGLDIGSEGAMKAWLQGSIPLPGGAHLRATRFTPMSLATDPLGTLAGAVLPQFSSVLKAFEGKDWTGKDLKGKDGGPPGMTDELKAAALAFIQSTVPGVSTAQTIKKHGLIGLPQSAVGYTAPASSGNTGSAAPAPTGRGFTGSRFQGSRFQGSSRRFSGASRFR